MLKITTVAYKNAKLIQPPSNVTRPISQKVRAAIFNTLQGRVEGANILDLFAGSGAMALEALSLGVDTATLVDKNSKSIAAIRANVKSLAVEAHATIVQADVEKFVIQETAKYDIIFLDPPYAEFAIELVNKLADLVQYGGVVVVSCSSKSSLDGLSDNLSLVQHKIYGDTQIAYIVKKIQK